MHQDLHFACYILIIKEKKQIENFFILIKITNRSFLNKNRYTITIDVCILFLLKINSEKKKRDNNATKKCHA
jgi:hypothetical protein